MNSSYSRIPSVLCFAQLSLATQPTLGRGHARMLGCDSPGHAVGVRGSAEDIQVLINVFEGINICERRYIERKQDAGSLLLVGVRFAIANTSHIVPQNGSQRACSLIVAEEVPVPSDSSIDERLRILAKF